MKKVLGRKGFIALVIISVYVVGQLSGVVAIRYYFLQSKIEELQPQLREIENDISAGNEIPSYNFFMIKAYDISGEKINVFTEEPANHLLFKDERVEETLLSYLPSVTSGNPVAELRDVPGLPSDSIVLGEPIVEDGNITGAIFLLKPASDYKAALQGFYLVFFITFTLGALAIIFFLGLFIKERNQLDQIRRDYVANISHELRSPLSSIKALTETLADGIITDSKKVNQYYGIILRESVRLETLVSDLLELSRLQSGKIRFEKTSVNTREIVERAIEPFVILSEELGIELIVSKNIQTLPPIYTNEDRIIQVITILLDNAVKFSEKMIYIETEFDKRQVKISVRDDGPGIPKDQLQLVFDRFHKGDISRNSRGSGLGLSIADEIMKQLHGDLTVESKVGEGTTFSIFVNRT